MAQTHVSTAERILTAALPLFVAHGYAGASLERVRKDAGVSNGSLYHHFPRRADLAARLLNDGMRECQDAIVAVVSGDRPAEQVIRSVVAEQLSWVERRADVARWVFSDLPDEVLLAAEPDLGEDARRYAVVVGDWLDQQSRAGTIVEGSFGVRHALWLGPATEFARHWLRGRSRQRPTDAAPDLAEGAWRALAAHSDTANRED
ncbi:TetR/AcrR family transcriptional regulator [Geodermatophilus sp. SYSU D00691]